MVIEWLEGRVLLSASIADANGDQRVDTQDFTCMASHFGLHPASISQGDFNGDQRVNLLDFNVLASLFGQTVDSNVITPANSNIFHSPDSISARSITTTFTPATGSTIVLMVATKRASGLVTLTVTDDQLSNHYTLRLNSATSGTGSSIKIYTCIGATGGAPLSFTITPSVSVQMTVAVVELTPSAGMAIRYDTATGFGDNVAAEEVDIGLRIASEFVLGAATQFTGSPIAVTGSATHLNAFDGTGGDLPMDLQYAGSATNDSGTGQFAMTWTWASSCSNREAAIALVETPVSTATAGVPADYRIDVRDTVAALGALNPAPTEHSGGTAGTSVGASYNVLQNGPYNIPYIAVTAGAGTGIFAAYHQPLATILVACSVTAASAQSVFGMDDQASGSLGAYYVATDSSNNAKAQVVTDAADASFNDGGIGSGMGGAPVVVYGLTLTGSTAKLYVNGFAVGTKTLAGTPLTPHASHALRILNAWVSGGDASPATGKFFEARCFTTAITDAEIRRQSSEMAWAAGPQLDKRVAVLSHDSSTSTMWMAQSSDGITFTNQRAISLVNPLGNGSRDCSFEGYDSGTDAYYFCYTNHNFTSFGTTFGRFKTHGDFRLCVPAASVDCSGASGIDGVSVSPWGPIPVFNNGTLVKYTFTKSNTATIFEADASGWPAAPTLGTSTALSGNVGDQSTIIYPSNRGNPSASLYRLYGSAGKYQTASGIDGVYGSTVTLAGGSTGEGGFTLDLGSPFLFYNPATSGWVAWASSDNGATFGAVQAVQGLNIATGGPIDLGQGGFIDRKALGLWTPPNSRLSLGLSLGL